MIDLAADMYIVRLYHYRIHNHRSINVQITRNVSNIHTTSICALIRLDKPESRVKKIWSMGSMGYRQVGLVWHCMNPGYASYYSSKFCFSV